MVAWAFGVGHISHVDNVVGVGCAGLCQALSRAS